MSDSIGTDPQPVAFDLLQCVQKGHQVGSFRVRENEAKVNLVVTDDAFDCRSNAVMEVRRACGERAYRRRLEATQVVPEPGDLAPTCVGQLADLARRPVAKSEEGKIRRARLFRRGADVEQGVVDIGAVVCRVVATAATAPTGVSVVE